MGIPAVASMNAIDYSRSFIQFTVDAFGNTPRTSIDASCTLTFVDGNVRQFVLGNACIGENMYVRDGLVQRPGTEFLQIASHNDQFMFVKDAGGACPDLRAAHHIGQMMPTHDKKGVTLESIDVSIIEYSDMTPLTSHDQVCHAMLANKVINARTSYVDPDDGTSVVMDYQVRCCNVTPEGPRWQVDTGRILALARRANDSVKMVERLAPAYIVYNDWDLAEIAVQALSSDGTRAARYDDIRSLEVKNELFVVAQ